MTKESEGGSGEFDVTVSLESSDSAGPGLTGFQGLTAMAVGAAGAALLG